MGASSDEITQRDLLGAGATIARSHGWLVVDLHGQRTNPRQQSGPDHLLLRSGQARVHKYLLSGDLSIPQTKVKALYVDAGIDYEVYSASPDSIIRLNEDLA